MSIFDRAIDCKNEHCSTNFVPDTDERREAGYCKTCQPELGGPIAKKPIPPELDFVWKQDRKLHKDILKVFNEEIFPKIVDYVDKRLEGTDKSDNLTECATEGCSNKFEKKAPAHKFCDKCKSK